MLTLEEVKTIAQNIAKGDVEGYENILYPFVRKQLSYFNGHVPPPRPSVRDLLALAVSKFPTEAYFSEFFSLNPILINRYMPRSTLLYDAVGKDDTLLVALLEDPSINVNKGIKHRSVTPLDKACSGGHLNAVIHLLNHPNIDVNRITDVRYTTEMSSFSEGKAPLHRAVEKGNEEILEKLLAHPRINVNIHDSIGNTPYVYAVALSKKTPENPAFARMAERLARVPGSIQQIPRFPCICDGEENPPNFYSGSWFKELSPDYKRHGEIFRKLKDSTTEEFRTFVQANPQSLNDVVNYIPDDNMYPTEFFRFPNAFNTIHSIGATALMYACREEYKEKVAILLEQPTIDVKQTGSIVIYMYFSEYCFTQPNVSFPLMFSWFSQEITEMLLAHPSIDVNQTNIYRETALMIASEKGRIDVVKTLLKVPSINLNLRNKEDNTALSLAAKGGHTQVVRTLLKDARLNRKLIKQAAFRAEGHVEITQLCVRNLTGTNNEIQRAKRAILRRAYMSGSLELVLWLISQGASITNHEYTVKKKGIEQERFIVAALKNAAKEGHLSILRHLLKESKYKLTDSNIMGAPDYIEEDKDLRAEYEAAGLELIPDKKSLFGMAVQNGRIDVVSYLASQNMQKYINVAWMNSLGSGNEKRTESFSRWINYLKCPSLVNINYRGAEGTTLLMKACSGRCDYIYVDFLLRLPNIDVLAKDNSGRTALDRSYGEKEKLINDFIEADKILQQKQLRTLTEMCLFAKIPLNSDVRGIIGSFLIRHKTPEPPKKVFKKIKKVIKKTNPPLELSAEEIANIESEIEEAERRREMEDIDQELEDDSIWAERAEAEAIAEIDNKVMDFQELLEAYEYDIISEIEYTDRWGYDDHAIWEAEWIAAIEYEIEISQECTS